MKLMILNIRKHEGKRPLERHGHSYEDNIKVDSEEMVWARIV
jgi:hypothetical protein